MIEDQWPEYPCCLTRIYRSSVEALSTKAKINDTELRPNCHTSFHPISAWEKRGICAEFSVVLGAAAVGLEEAFVRSLALSWVQRRWVWKRHLCGSLALSWVQPRWV